MPPPVSLPRFDQGDVAFQGLLQDVGAAVDLAVLLADGHLGADAGGGEEGWDARAGGAHAFGEGALGDDLKLDLAGAVEGLEDDGIGTAGKGADDAADAAKLHEAGEADMARAGVVAGDDQVLGALLDQSVDQGSGLADGAETAEEDSGTIRDPGHQVSHGLDDFIDHGRWSPARQLPVWCSAECPACQGSGDAWPSNCLNSLGILARDDIRSRAAEQDSFSRR